MTFFQLGIHLINLRPNTSRIRSKVGTSKCITSVSKVRYWKGVFVRSSRCACKVLRLNTFVFACIRRTLFLAHIFFSALRDLHPFGNRYFLLFFLHHKSLGMQPLNRERLSISRKDRCYSLGNSVVVYHVDTVVLPRMIVDSTLFTVDNSCAVIHVCYTEIRQGKCCLEPRSFNYPLCTHTLHQRLSYLRYNGVDLLGHIKDL